MVLYERQAILQLQDPATERRASAVAFTFNLDDEKDFQDFKSRNPMYISAGLFVLNDQPRVVFSDTPRHQELKAVIEEELHAVLPDYNFVQLSFAYGKIAFISFENAPGQTDEEIEATLLFFFSQINHDFLAGSAVSIQYYRASRYIYVPSTRKLIKR